MKIFILILLFHGSNNAGYQLYDIEFNSLESCLQKKELFYGYQDTNVFTGALSIDKARPKYSALVMAECVEK